MAALEAVLDSGMFVLGPQVAELEQRVAEYCGVKHAIACASGSDALLLALMSRDIGPGDEVILPSYTFFATAGAVARLGAQCVFVDIEPHGYNIDPAQIEAAVTPATKAIIPVHLYGQCAEMDAIMAISERHNLLVIEDAAQAIGAEYQNQRAGAIGHVGCFSFYPTKNLGGCGDGGMLTTNDDELAATLSLLRVHGMQPRYFHKLVGINSRLDAMQAALLNVKMPHLESWTEARSENAARYVEMFIAAGLHEVLELPTVLPYRRHVWNQFICRIGEGRRDALRAALAARNIGSEIYYPVPMHAQECFRDLRVDAETLPETNRAAAETIALPIFPELTAAEQQTVVEATAAFFDKKPA
ncbi:MAG: DegT/DnrJ/EryC1/StrS family aminotransferase, partial [Pirellulales bacterium]